MMAGGVDMPAPLLITAAELAGKKTGDRITVPKGAIITPVAKDYASEHGICIVSEDGVAIVRGRSGTHEDDASRIVRNILRELRRELERVPTREEAIGFVCAVMEQARRESIDVINS
jgi:hypothetical protein